jgi:predicted nucleic acid-binding protein
MSYLADTNILLRLVEPSHSMHPDAYGAVEALLDRGETLYTLLQNIAEFWNVCTRPADKNGLGFSPAKTKVELKKLEAIITVVADIPPIYLFWRSLVVLHAVSGVQVHDARIVAAMIAHGIRHLLTFNGTDFKRYPGITLLAPQDVVPQTSPRP